MAYRVDRRSEQTYEGRPVQEGKRLALLGARGDGRSGCGGGIWGEGGRRTEDASEEGSGFHHGDTRVEGGTYVQKLSGRE